MYAKFQKGKTLLERSIKRGAKLPRPEIPGLLNNLTDKPKWPFSVWCFFKVWRVWFRRQPDHIDPIWQVVEAGEGDRRVERHHHWHRHRLQEDQQRLHLVKFQPFPGVPWRVDKQKGVEHTRGRFLANANYPNLDYGESCQGLIWALKLNYLVIGWKWRSRFSNKILL